MRAWKPLFIDLGVATGVAAGLRFDISGSRDDLLSASVPSRSNTISFFTILSTSEFFATSIRVSGPANPSRCCPVETISGSAISNKFTALRKLPVGRHPGEQFGYFRIAHN